MDPFLTFTPFLIENRPWLLSSVTGNRICRITRHFFLESEREAAIETRGKFALEKGGTPITLHFEDGTGLTFSGFNHLQGVIARKYFSNWDVWGELGLSSSDLVLSSDDTMFRTPIIASLLESPLASVELISPGLPRYSYQNNPRSAGIRVKTVLGSNILLGMRLSQYSQATELLQIQELKDTLAPLIAFENLRFENYLPENYSMQQNDQLAFRVMQWIQWVPDRKAKVVNKYSQPIQLSSSGVETIAALKDYLLRSNSSIPDIDLWIDQKGDVGFRGNVDIYCGQAPSWELKIIDCLLQSSVRIDGK
jgi:hypothetical protein